MTSIIQQLKSDFNVVIQHSQGISNIKSDSLLESWYEAKRHIIETWNGQLIVESKEKVTFELSPEEKRKRLDEFIESIAEVYGNDNLANFLEDISKDFFSNHLSDEYYQHESNIKIPKGTKVVKAFKYFESNKKALYDLQTQASMIIQEDKVNGILCMSVHPLDFLSSSENTYHWRSCHALDGDYRAGNLSYMLDKSTIVCYLKADNKLYKLPNFPETVLWNSKKWRMLLFLEDEVEALMAGRQYPFNSSNALTHIRHLFMENWNISPRLWSYWMDDYITEFPRNYSPYGSPRDLWLNGGRHVCLNGIIYSMDELITDAKYSRHFNDLKYSSCYIPMYCYTYYPKNNRRKLHFSIGAKVPCLYCNQTNIDVEASMVCLECGAALGESENDYYTYCGCCDRRVPRETTRWNNTIDEYICEECYRQYCRSCDNCEETWHSNDMKYSAEYDKYLCPCCYERLQQDNELPKPRAPFIDFDLGELPF